MMLSVLVDSLCIWHRRLGNANMKLIPKVMQERACEKISTTRVMCIFSC